MGNKASPILRPAALSSFCSQMALIIGAGIMISDAMESFIEDSADPQEKALFTTLRDNLNETGMLSDALRRDERWPKYMVEMTAIGEETGRLEQVMSGLASYYEREDHIRAAGVNAVTYPLVLAGMLIVIVLIMLIRVLPVFNRVLSGMGVDMSGSGSRFMRLGSVLGWGVLAVVGVLIFAVIACVVLLKTKHRGRVLRLIRRVFPPYAALEKKLAASRVASVLSMVISGGFPIESAIGMTASVLPDEDSAARVQKMREDLEAGVSFTDALNASGLFEELHTRMIRMGVAAGREDEVMKKISDLYEDQVQEGISKLISIIEPTLIALLSVVIGAILLSVMLPMAGILTSLF